MLFICTCVTIPDLHLQIRFQWISCNVKILKDQQEGQNVKIILCIYYCFECLKSKILLSLQFQKFHCKVILGCSKLSTSFKSFHMVWSFGFPLFLLNYYGEFLVHKTPCKLSFGQIQITKNLNCCICIFLYLAVSTFL